MMKLRISCTNLLLKYTCSLSTTQTPRTHYDVLGVTKNASQADIKDAFVDLSKQVTEN